MFAERDAGGGVEQDADFLDELMLVVDPGLVCAGGEGFDGFAAYAGDGIVGDEGEKRLPLERCCIKVLDWIGSGVE